MAFHMTEGVRWLYGPVGCPHQRGDLEHLVLTPISRAQSTENSECVQSSGATLHWAFVQGQRARDNAGMRRLGRGLSRPIDIPRLIDKFRLLDEAQPLLTRYTLSDRRGLTRQESYFHGRCSGEAPGALAGWLLMVGGSCVI